MIVIQRYFKQLSAALRKQDGRRAFVPLFMQGHATECGAACLGSVLAYFGHWVPLAELRDRCEVGRDGSTAAGILRAARHYGLQCTGHSVDLTSLRSMRFPLVLFWEFNHFLILEGFNRKQFFLFDPAVGRRSVSTEEFSRGFTGVALQFRLTSAFKPSRMRRKGLRQYMSLWLQGSTGAVTFTVACGLLLAVLALVMPASLTLFVDWAIGEHDVWGAPIVGLVAVTAVLVYGLTWVQQRCEQRLAIRIAIVISNRCVSRLLRLPIHFFNHRFAGDLATRVMSIDHIAKVVFSEQLLGSLIEAVMALVLLAVLLVFSPTLMLIIMLLALLHAAVAGVIARFSVDASQILGREQGLLLGISTLMLGSATNLYMTSMDDQFYGRWAGYQARELTARQRLTEYRYVGGALPGLFTIMNHCAVLIFCTDQVVAGEMTLGALVGFYVLVAMLPSMGRFADLLGGFQAGQTSLMRLEDILGNQENSNTPTDAPVKTSPTMATPKSRKWQLTGHVELRGVTFGYSRSRPPLIKNFNLTIKPGQRVAIVGPSGSGKSTLSRLVSGLCQPWSGEILFDGSPRSEIPNEILLRSLGMVDQHVILFSGTVRDNITLWSPAIPDHIVVNAARDACIHDDILMRPLGYEAQVAEDGQNLSGGQRQRLEIARTLAGNPTILILDEATSALDAATEKKVDNALRRRGMSCLIVAHRLSTIRDCDEIIVLDGGEEVQRGTHEQLMTDTSGTYSQLFRAG